MGSHNVQTSRHPCDAAGGSRSRVVRASVSRSRWREAAPPLLIKSNLASILAPSRRSAAFGGVVRVDRCSLPTAYAATGRWCGAKKWRCLVAPPSLGRKRPRKQTARPGAALLRCTTQATDHSPTSKILQCSIHESWTPWLLAGNDPLRERKVWVRGNNVRTPP